MQRDFKNRYWIYTILPMSALSGGFSILIPILILFLNGNVLNVSIAVTVAELIAIPASILWSELTDRFRVIRKLVLLSIASTLPLLILLDFTASITFIYIVYGVYILLATAASPAINIILMGHKKSDKLPKLFSWYSTLTVCGSIIAYLPGIFLNARNINLYIIMLAVINVIALSLSYGLIPEAKRSFIRRQARVEKRTFPILNILTVIPNVLTNRHLIERIRRVWKGDGKNKVYLLITSIALFNAGVYLFNTSYIPFLKDHGLTYGGIFLINLVNAIGQIAVYVVLLVLLRRLNLHLYYRFSVLLRSIGYVIVIIPFLYWAFTYINLISYSVGGFAIALWNVASSVLIYDRIRGKKEGHFIGIWLAALGFSAVVGSGISGIISLSLGYIYTFILGIALNGISLLLFRRSQRYAYGD